MVITKNLIIQQTYVIGNRLVPLQIGHRLTTFWCFGKCAVPYVRHTESAPKQSSKSLVRIVWIDQSQYKLEFNITLSRIAIGHFKQYEPTISDPALNLSANQICLFGFEM